jgi:hypothetical protein
MLTVLRQFEASLVMWASRHPGLAVVLRGHGRSLRYAAFAVTVMETVTADVGN